MKNHILEKKTLIIITGGPGTGKSYAAKELLSFLSDVPVVSVNYDHLKEEVWDRDGFENEEEKKEANERALTMFFEELEAHMAKEDTLLIEYPFYQYHRPFLQELIDKYGYHAITIYLHTDLKTAYERGNVRDDSGRHPGHLLNRYHKETYTPEDLLTADRHFLSYEEFLRFIKGREYNLMLGDTYTVDVTDFSKVHYNEIFNTIFEKEPLA